MRITNSGNVGIGTTSPSQVLHVKDADYTRIQIEAGTTSHGAILNLGDSSDADYGSITQFASAAGEDGRMRFVAGATETMNLRGGNVGIGTNSPTEKLDVNGGTVIKGSLTNGSGTGSALRMQHSSNISEILSLEPGVAWRELRTNASQQTFYIAGGEKMRIDSSGNLLVGKTSTGTIGTVGIDLRATGLAEFTAYDSQGIAVNRLNTDGVLVYFLQGTSFEGDISVSGATVSYNGFSGNHETSGISTDTEIGTVCSTIDELDTYVSGTKSGQTRGDHAKIKVSDTVGDTRVYGVLSSYSERDNKPIVASVGIGSVKVTGACSGGDLLESNGDGTAKVQSDDIVRSKTIGKVTIGNSDTGVKLVSCVLYCG
jgi:hypothetical protein